MAQEAEAKLKTLFQQHREQSEKASEILSAHAPKVLEEDLLRKIEAAQLESAEALDSTQKEAAQQLKLSNGEQRSPEPNLI